MFLAVVVGGFTGWIYRLDCKPDQRKIGPEYPVQLDCGHFWRDTGELGIWRGRGWLWPNPAIQLRCLDMRSLVVIDHHTPS